VVIGSVLVTLTDSDLLDLVRRGDETAFTELYTRHREVAQRMAAVYCRPGEADDLADLAFEKVLGALRRGRGPTGAFRAYLFVTLRRLAAEQAERPRERSLDDLPEPLAAVAATPSLDPAEREMITTAFESLPGRWQAVLWHTAVEGRHPRDLASLLGMSANAVSALAYRAREKLRQAYLQAHLQAAPHPQCEPHRSSLGAFVREGQSPRERRATSQHLEQCRSCQALVSELLDVNRLLARAVLPLFAVGSAAKLGAAIAGGVGAAEATAHAARRSLWGWARLHQAGAVASAAAATAALVVGLAELRPHIESADPAPPDVGTTVETPGEDDSVTGHDETVGAVRASNVTPCPVGESAPLTPTTTTADLLSSILAPVTALLSPTTPTTAPPATSPSLTQVLCTPTEPGRSNLTVTVAGAEAPAATDDTEDDGGGGVDVAVGGDLPVQAAVTVELDDGVRVAIEAGLPEGCEVTEDRSGLTCVLASLSPGALAEATVGLEVEAPEDAAPSATVTVSNGDQTIVSQTLDLSPVADLLSPAPPPASP
jgi:RNA polymerase sigma factor (sigma-70 family)